MNMCIKSFMFLIFCLFIGCSSDEETTINKQINADALSEIDGISTGKYYILTDITETTYNSCVYLPFPDKQTSIACDASLTGKTIDPVLRLKDGTENVVYIPSGNGKYAGVEFDLNTGKALNKEAEGIELKVYSVSYDKKNKVYRLTYNK